MMPRTTFMFTRRFMRSALLLGAAMCTAAATPAAASAPPPDGRWQPRVLDPSQFQRVDPAFGDTDPLRMSLRELSVDLRQSDDFSNVYRIPGGRPDGLDDRFARRSGGITAVFPRSTYFETPEGVGAAIPPGTVFYLDGVPAPQPWEAMWRDGGEPALSPASAPSAGQRLYTGVNTNVAGIPPAAVGEPRIAGGATEAERVAASPEGSGLFVGARTLLRRAAAAPR